ncbi:MAG: dipeptidase [Planctomycetes bacterium]|nr:dipeptidase [Planctomycetota bacterium]
MLALAIATLATLAAALQAQQAPPATPARDDPALVERARRIHARVLTLDTHKDISPLLASDNLPEDEHQRQDFLERFDPTVDGQCQVDFPKMRRGGYVAAFFIVYVDQGDLNPPGFRRAYSQARLKFEAIQRMCVRFPDQIELARTPADVLRIAAAGKLVACIGIENGYPVGEDLERIAEFHALGARYMSISHNRHSQLGDSHTPAEPLHGGLSALGRDAIAELNRIGIMVDVSHAAKSTMMQAVELSRAPVIASHSGCRAICDHARNLDDEQLLAMRNHGGVVQIVALDEFVRDQSERSAAVAALRQELDLGRWGRRDAAGNDLDLDEYLRRSTALEARMPEIDARFPRANVADFVDHIDHAVKVMGIDHVGIASDFDGGGGIAGWDNAGETFDVTLELVRRGYTEEQIAKIWSGNLLRVWGEVERVAQLIQSGH